MGLYKGGRESSGPPTTPHSLHFTTHMFTYNNTLNIVDFGFTALDRIERVDAVSIGEKVIQTSLTVTATIHAIIQYITIAIMCWWDSNGETVLTNTFRFTVWILDTIGAVYYTGVNSRPVLTLWANRVMDNAYRYAAQL